MSEKYTRADIAKMITEIGIERVNAAGLALAIVKLMADALIAGKAIELRGLGTLEVKERKAYKARNPKTGEPLIASARRRILFRPGQELRATLKNEPEESPAL
jgi:DNA-binding protein HU-beta/integration host factor subunit beta